ncbi:hypothetical protein Scep_020786 [Stephania cephalantha]|uniref:Large ribosomal subunit protein uL1c n=1 Tax=Stephania cephalantha TaxID=152367 RepID=A0AAP0IEI5_9MAGN
MAALHHFLSRARRHRPHPPTLNSTLLRLRSSSSSPPPALLGFLRPFSSDPSPLPVVKSVSYSLRPPKEEEEEEKKKKKPSTPPHSLTNNSKSSRRTKAEEEEVAEQQQQQQQQQQPLSFTREDIRYVKDLPSISPVSYNPSRVAPLPQDKKPEVDRKLELDRESKRIEKDAFFRKVFKAEEDNLLPYPALIKVDKKKPKVVLHLQEAIRELKANAKRNFDETVEAHVNLGVDGRRGDQMVRGSALLPHGTGKTVRIAVFAEGAAADEARAAGADIVGGEELVEEIRKGGSKLNFDKCISTPSFMPRLGKISKILGPRGLMPNPKLGSVTSDVAVAVRAAKHGRIDFKIDKTAIVHVGLGKISFPEDSIRENVGAFMNALLLAKPVGLKKTSKYAGYVNSFTLCSTMGPGFPVSIQSLSIAADHYNKLQLK